MASIDVSKYLAQFEFTLLQTTDEPARREALCILGKWRFDPDLRDDCRLWAEELFDRAAWYLRPRMGDVPLNVPHHGPARPLSTLRR